MTVWIVNPFDTLPQEGGRSMRYWLMARAFAREGHDVVYWTADFNHATKRPRSPETLAADGGDIDGVKLVAVHEPPYKKNISLRRLWAHWRWAKNWRKAATRFVEERGKAPELTVVSSPPLCICGEARKFARRTGGKVIVDVMDAWPETFERVAPRWALCPLRRLARANYLGADAVTTVADNYIETVRGYGYTGPVRRFYHGISIGAAPARGTDAGGTAAASPLRIAYVGNLGRTYDLETVIEAVGMVDGATLEIAGAGDMEESLRRFASAQTAAGRVTFRGYLGVDGLARLLAGADVGVVPMPPESCVGIPYKLADYSAAGLAVASSLGGECDRILALYNAGASYRWRDPQSLANALGRIKAALPAMKAASRRMAEELFDESRIYKDYVDFATSME